MDAALGIYSRFSAIFVTRRLRGTSLSGIHKEENVDDILILKLTMLQPDGCNLYVAEL